MATNDGKPSTVLPTTHEGVRGGNLTDDDLRRLYLQLSKMRASGVHALRSWLDASEQQLGGRLVLQAPSKIGSSGKGHLPEAAFQSQFWGALLTGDMPG